MIDSFSESQKYETHPLPLRRLARETTVAIALNMSKLHFKSALKLALAIAALCILFSGCAQGIVARTDSLWREDGWESRNPKK